MFRAAVRHIFVPRARSIATLALAVGLFALWPVAEAAATNVSGTISSNTTWTLANSPYVMTGNVTVNSGVMLTIEPGVTVQGNSSSRVLTINGALSAEGTSSSHITFTSTSDSGLGQWGRLVFSSGAGTSTLAYVDARYGGGNSSSYQNGMVEINGGTVTIEDSTFKESKVSGLGVSGASTAVTISRSLFQHNGYGATLGGNGLIVSNAQVTVEDSAFWSNNRDGIDYLLLSTYSSGAGAISGSSIWSNARYGVWISQDASKADLGPDGNVSGEPGNEIYDNGAFSWAAIDGWTQLSASQPSLDVDWSGTYWGPLIFVPCGGGTRTGTSSSPTPRTRPSTRRAPSSGGRSAKTTTRSSTRPRPTSPTSTSIHRRRASADS